MKHFNIRNQYLKVLIIEDDPHVLSLLYTAFNTKGFSAFKASNGEEALRILPVLKPELVLVDITLPKINGLEVCKIIRQMIGEVDPVVMVISASNSEEDKIKAYQQWVDEYITKPFDMREVLNKAIRHLEKKMGYCRDKKKKEWQRSKKVGYI